MRRIHNYDDPRKELLQIQNLWVWILHFTYQDTSCIHSSKREESSSRDLAQTYFLIFDTLCFQCFLAKKTTSFYTLATLTYGSTNCVDPYLSLQQITLISHLSIYRSHPEDNDRATGMLAILKHQNANALALVDMMPLEIKRSTQRQIHV